MVAGLPDKTKLLYLCILRRFLYFVFSITDTPYFYQKRQTSDTFLIFRISLHTLHYILEILSLNITFWNNLKSFLMIKIYICAFHAIRGNILITDNYFLINERIVTLSFNFQSNILKVILQINVSKLYIIQELMKSFWKN